ncbi:MAG: DUF2282 domain-containing protein [Bdellovibrionales bacterium]
MVSKKTVNTLLASAVALTVAGGIGAAKAETGDKEKCYGVVKAGHNDCANAGKTHSCAGHAEADGAGDEWITLPAGVCERLAGGSLEPHAGDHDDMEHGEEH